MHRDAFRWLVGSWSLIVLLVLSGCSSSGGEAQGAAGQGEAGGPTSFESDNPYGSNGQGGGYNGSADGGASAGSAGSSAGGSGGNGKDAEKTILEADIIQMQGNRLFALSQYGGLGVVDMANPDNLVMLGRYRIAAVPFEMYLRNNVVLAMYSTFHHLEYNDAGKYYEWVSSSRVLALDVADPANIALVASFDIPGEVSDSRIVGDIMYVVSYESGYCWHCDNDPRTTITALNVANPQAITTVDQLAYTTPSGYSWSKRSVTVNQDRIYVAGPEWSYNNSDHSTIQVVDISDPTGKMVPGASVPVKGQIESRWQMDEYQGVLRVISQSGSWAPNGTAPVVETFQVVSSQQLQKLGELTMTIPANERLQSVRFDGTRGYAVTFVQTDPLFSLDLTDPAKPLQVGELHMPGFLYHMEPRGDRMIALGLDNNNPEGGVTVSVFDVSDLATLTLLSRVNFGGQWGWMAEDQDRIQKAFRIFDEHNLIVVPFSGYTYSQDYCTSTYVSGVQLVDLHGDALALRGLVPQHGQARRAFVHQSRLLAVSNERVSSFNIDDRDAPLKTSELEFTHRAFQSKVVGQVVAQLSTDWYTNENKLVITPVADPDRGHPLAELDLAPLTGANNKCGYYGGFYSARMFANGTQLYVVWDRSHYNVDTYSYEQGLGIATIELADPYHPAILGQAELPLGADYGWSYYDYEWGYWSGGLVSTGKSIVQSGSTLAVSTGIQGYYYYGEQKQDPSVHLIDLSNPAQPSLASSFPLPAGTLHTLLQVYGSTVLTSHAEPVPGNPGKVRFFVDQFNVSDPAHPVALPAINVPGSLLTLDQGSQRAVTVDYVRELLTAADWNDCHQKGGTWSGGYYGSPDAECIRVHKLFRLVQLNGAYATLLDTMDLDDGRISSIAVGQDRIFLLRGSSYYYYGNPGPQPETSLQAISGMTSGKLHAGVPKVVDTDPYAWGTVLAVSGQRVLLDGDYPPHLSVYDSTDPDALTLVQKTDLYGYVYNVEVTGNTAICSLGDWGLQSVSIAP